MPDTISAPRHPLRVTEIGEYIRHDSCGRRFKLAFKNRELARRLPFSQRLFNTLDPVLQETGRIRENEWEETLVEAEYLDLTNHTSKPDGEPPTDWNAFSATLSTLSANQNAYGREVRLNADIGKFSLEGRIDFILINWIDGQPTLRLVECKASRRDRTYHRIQIALYRKMLQKLLSNNPLVINGRRIDRPQIECVVARIDENTNDKQSIIALEPLDLEMEEADIHYLLVDGGELDRIVTSELDEQAYKIDNKCDGCVFNTDCLPESALHRRLELLSLAPSTIRQLKKHSVTTIDQLAELNLSGDQANEIRKESGFSDNLNQLVLLAKARRSTLPRGDVDPEEYQVQLMPNVGKTQLPAHTISGAPMIRIYLSVDYDYSENRIGALSAHITKSTGRIHTGFVRDGERWKRNPNINEQLKTGEDAEKKPTFSEQPIGGVEVIEFITSEWTGTYDADTGSEKQLIQGFLNKLVDAIASVAETDEAPIHFYVWSRNEMTRLVEACSRVSTRLLSHLRELLGCRESLEQLIFSSLQEEVDRRFGLGWTGRGLSVVSSLRWYGRIYHWLRIINGTEVDLSHVFTQDLFDFKTDLEITPAGTWARPGTSPSTKHKFEIRSRFHDSLPAPYWRAFWDTLPDPTTVKSDMAEPIRRYNQARTPGTLAAYFRARTHALRWIEESIPGKNDEIQKPLMKISELRNFSLGIDNAAQAAIDFLRLDQHIKVSQWVADHLLPPITRTPKGRTIQVKDVTAISRDRIRATINLASYGFDLSSLETRCSIDKGSFVRLNPCFEDPHIGQTVGQLMRGGRTCTVESINWTTGGIELSPITINPSRYMLTSAPTNIGRLFDHATIDENVSDFVAQRVEARLLNGLGTHMYQWFDPADPEIPLATEIAEPERLKEDLHTLVIGNDRFNEDQIDAAVTGLSTTVHLLQGPPGTGKTQTTSLAALLRVMKQHSIGDIMLVGAHTHTAVDTLLNRISQTVQPFTSWAETHGQSIPKIFLAKVHSSSPEEASPNGINDINASACARAIKEARRDSILILGGTTSALLKMAEKLSGSADFRNLPNGFQASSLIVDEASMMVFPHFLALATLMNENGSIMLAGDHRQLAPIISHDWEREDRPPAVFYQPFASAYQAITNLISNPDLGKRQVDRSSLKFSFRLPPLIRELIARLYRLDQIELAGPERPITSSGPTLSNPWQELWRNDTGLYLVLHNERESRQSNELEAEIVRQILANAPSLEPASIGLITPHRAQRSLLRSKLSSYHNSADVIDTVERLQGNERKTIIVSATVSDPASIGSNVEFILNLNRANVAFSRARNRLIVVCSESLLAHIPAEIEHYESAMLWKSLRSLCSEQVASTNIDSFGVKIFSPKIRSST